MDLIHKIESLRYDIENGVETDVIKISVRLIQIKDQALQLQQTGVNGSFFKCTCLNPQSNCFSGKCSYCNQTIVKDITTDDM